ncbi:MAG: WbqC family protein [Chloroflexi bacterium]|nr:WbqC family protein [Chloroflexota bacterium]
MSVPGVKVVILQPMYLPWVGFFEQIKLCDIFVHFDDVQLPQGRHFTNRVQIKTPRGQQWMTVPLVRSSRGLIKDVQMDESSDWRNLHLRTFSQYLAKTPFWAEAIGLLEQIYSFKSDKLSDFNINAIETIASYLRLERVFLKSSDLNVGGSSSSKLLNIVKSVKGQTYITGHGAKNYLDHRLFEEAGVEVEYLDYNILPYQQLYGEFTPYVSVIDLIANNDVDSMNFLKSRTIQWEDFIRG